MKTNNISRSYKNQIKFFGKIKYYDSSGYQQIVIIQQTERLGCQ